ncbi:MAG: hypothetical protein ABIU63_17875 [Chitinophagaceae bacterium]
MKTALPIAALLVLLTACNTKTSTENSQQPAPAIVGTWQLISGTTIEKNDTVTTDYTQQQSFIKIINDTHFAFLKHDLNKGKDTATAAFTSGGGRYALTDSVYTEHLEYCSDRAWEGNDFSFAVTIRNDTLIQQGVEKVESAGVNRINIEKYVRVKK